MKAVAEQIVRRLWIIIWLTLYATIHADWAEEQLRAMTLAQKIGQLFIIEVANGRDVLPAGAAARDTVIEAQFTGPRASYQKVVSLIKEYGVGGIHFIGHGTLAPTLQIVNELQNASTIPLLVTQDFEYGPRMRLTDALRFPKAMTLGALPESNNKLIFALGKAIGRQCRALGVHINFAPVADVNNNPNNPIINERSFGEDPHRVAQKAIAYMRGMRTANIIPCAKHFPGHGDTTVDSHKALPIITHSRTRLERVELTPFKELIQAGVPAIMTAHIQVPALDERLNRPATLSDKILTTILKKELGFNGLIITDGLGMRGISDHFDGKNAALEAFLAGNDILLMAQDVPGAITLITQAIQRGTVTQDDLDARVLKILRTKESLGLNKKRLINARLQPNELSTPADHALKRQAYRAAITLAQNNNQTLPLARQATIGIIQVGSPDTTPFIAHMRKNFSKITTLSEQRDQLAQDYNQYDAIIVALFGMNQQGSQNYGISAETQKLITELQQTGVPFTVVIFGSPYSIKLFEKNKAIIVAYEDDPDAQEGAADVIAGSLNPSGILPVSPTPQFPAGRGLQFPVQSRNQRLPRVFSLLT